jgi:hypothetical protein
MGIIGGTLNWLSGAAMLKSKRIASTNQAVRSRPDACAVFVVETVDVSIGIATVSSSSTE